MIQVKITQAMKVNAIIAEKRTILALPKNGKDPTGVNAKRKWFFGYLGEFVVLDHAIRQGLKLSYKPIYDGQRHEVDITFYHLGKEIPVDVKTGSEGFHQLVSQPLQQYEKDSEYEKMLVIGVRINRQTQLGEIMGWCWKHELRRATYEEEKKLNKGVAPGKAEHYMVRPYTDLYDTDSFFRGLGIGDQDITWPEPFPEQVKLVG